MAAVNPQAGRVPVVLALRSAGLGLLTTASSLLLIALRPLPRALCARATRGWDGCLLRWQRVIGTVRERLPSPAARVDELPSGMAWRRPGCGAERTAPMVRWCEVEPDAGTDNGRDQIGICRGPS